MSLAGEIKTFVTLSPSLAAATRHEITRTHAQIMKHVAEREREVVLHFFFSCSATCPPFRYIYIHSQSASVLREIERTRLPNRFMISIWQDSLGVRGG